MVNEKILIRDRNLITIIPDPNTCDHPFYLYERGGSSYELSGAFHRESYAGGVHQLKSYQALPAQHRVRLEEESQEPEGLR